MPGAITLRPVSPSDDAFLRRVYAGTRQQELQLVDWTDTQREAFLRMQFDAQDQHYRRQYPNAEFSVVLVDGTPVGRLYLDATGGELRIIDIALLPEWRGKGIGSSLLRTIVARAESHAQPILIHVERFSPALRLYQRFGFVIVEEGPVYCRMVREAGE